MGLKETYESWAFKAGNKYGTKTPRDQKDGNLAVDFLLNTYQTEVRNRTPGDKTVTQATADNATLGTFNVTAGPGKLEAFKQYTRFTTNTRLTTYKSKLVHVYNAQGTPEQKFTTSNAWKNQPGVLYSTNPPG